MSNGLRELNALCGANLRAAVHLKAPRRSVASIVASLLAQAFSRLQRGEATPAASTRRFDAATPVVALDLVAAQKGATRAVARRRRAHAQRNRKRAVVMEVDHVHGVQADLPSQDG